MKNEYHLTISRADRIWLIVFVCFLLGWELIKPFLPKRSLPEMNISAFFIQPDDSISITMDADSMGYHQKSNENTHKVTADVQKDTVDIMQATWAQLRQLGISSKAASNISKYIAAGGIVKNAQALGRIYGMDSIQLREALPYLKFPAPTPNKAEPKDDKKWNNRTYSILDLNTATATDLETLPGIGTVLAERIISYRTSLGGFQYVDQLSEVYGIPPETVTKVKDRVEVITPPQWININQADLSTLRHPYLSKRLTKMLSAYRAQHGRIENEKELRKVFPPDTTWCEKILPYVRFE